MVYSNMEKGGKMTESFPYKMGNFIHLSKYKIAPVAGITKISVEADRLGVQELVIKFEDVFICRYKNIDLKKVLEWLNTDEGYLYNE